MTDAQVRWGIVATGNISDVFASDLALVDDARIGAVASRDLDRSRAFAADHDAPDAACFGSYDELIERATDVVDVVYLGTLHPTHYRLAHAFLSAGVAVLAEKPVTLNARQVEDLVALSRTTGVLFAEAMWMRCNPVIRAIADDVRSGRIGEPRLVQADFGIAPEPVPPRLLEPELGGGALLDLGIYPATFAQLLLGAPSEVRAVGHLFDTGVDRAVAWSASYAGGATATLSCTIGAEGPNRASISGSEGTILVAPTFLHPPYYERVRGDGEPERIAPETIGRGYAYEAVAVQDALRDGAYEVPLLPHAGTVDVLRTLDTIRDQLGVTYAGDAESIEVGT